MKRSRLIDISMPLRNGMPGFPGDPPFRRRRFARFSRGDPADTSELAMSAHGGTHVDAPRHMLRRDSRGIDAMGLDPFFGPARVFHLPRARILNASALARLDWRGVARVLFRTRNSARWRRGERFFPDFTGISPDGAAFLARRRLRLVGIDSLSVEPFRTVGFPAHRILLERGIALLEGLLLDGVAPGDYTLCAAPLAISRSDGAPARAFLVRRH